MSESSSLPTLAEALRSVPVPMLSPDFDDAVLTALRAPWWQRLWQPAQPLLLGASGSFGLTLLLLRLTLSAPQVVPSLPVSAPAIAAASAPLPSVDALLDRPGLCAGSLAAWNSLPTTEAAPEPPRRPQSRRRAEVTQRRTLIA